MPSATGSTEQATFDANRAKGAIALTVGARDGITHRQRVAESGSLRVRFPNVDGATLEAVSINTAGGTAGGDRYAIDVTVGEGASLVMTSASAEKVYRSLGEESAISVALKVGVGAQLSWLPRETILFDRARLTRAIDVDLADDARFLLAEAVVFGRASMGETVQTGRLTDRWRVRRGGRLAYAESLTMDGDIADRLARRAVANGGIALATLLMAPSDERFVAALREAGPRLRGEAGASTFNGLTAARFCADDGESLRHDLMLALEFALDGPLPRLWLN